MDADLAFRFAAVATFAAALIVSGFHRHRADRHGGPLPAAAPPGQPSLPFRLAAAAVIWGTLIASIAVPARVSWMIVPLPVPVRWAGLALGVLAVPLLWWLMRSLGTSVSPSTATRAGARLVTHGPYRWVRHPLYSVGTLMFFGLGLAAQSLGMLVVVAVTAWWLRSRARHEEARLIESYGDRYREYMKTTGRFIPRFR